MSIRQRNKYYAAHQYSAHHRQQVLESECCGCFYCLEIFPATKIEEWVDEDENGIGMTALCPFCGIDAVVGDKSGIPIKREFLKAMKQVWF